MEPTDQLKEVDKAVAALVLRISQQIRRSATTVINEARKIEKTGFRQAEALGNLRQLLGPEIRLPHTRGWAASPDFLVYLFDHIVSRRPEVLLELGSGVSTLVTAVALRKNGKGHLHSVEHQVEHLKRTNAMLRYHGLDKFVTLLHAPLVSWRPDKPTSLGDHWQWYDIPESIGSLGPIVMLVVDGPPGPTGPHARYPALPHFRAQLAPDAVVFMDDTIRAEETNIAHDWKLSWRMALELHPDFEKGLAVLTPKPVPDHPKPRPRNRKP